MSLAEKRDQAKQRKRQAATKRRYAEEYENLNDAEVPRATGCDPVLTIVAARGLTLARAPPPTARLDCTLDTVAPTHR